MHDIDGANATSKPRFLVLGLVHLTLGSVLGRLDKFWILNGGPLVTELVEKNPTRLLAHIGIFRDVIERKGAAKDAQDAKHQQTQWRTWPTTSVCLACENNTVTIIRRTRSKT